MKKEHNVFKSFSLTLLQFIITYKIWGFYFEDYEVLINLISNDLISDSLTPFASNNHFLIIPWIFKFQHYYPEFPIYGIYNTIILFIPTWIINHQFILKLYGKSLFIKLIYFSSVYLLLFESIVNQNNNRTSIILSVAFYIVVFSNRKSSLSYWLIIPIFILGTSIRLEMSIICSFLAFLYYILMNNSIPFYKVLFPIIISISFYFAFQFFQVQSNIMYLTSFKFEREFYDKENLKEINDSLVKEKVYQKAVMMFIEDRDLIKPSDYYNQIKYKKRIDYISDFSGFPSYYIKNLKSFISIYNERIYWVFLFIYVLTLGYTPLNKNKIIFFLIVILIPFILAIEAWIFPRFLIPYYGSILLFILYSCNNYNNNIALNILLITSFVFFIKTMNSESNQYLKKHDLFIIYNEALNRIKESGKKVVISNLACQAGFIYSPKLYYIPVRVDHYYLNFLFWTYAEPFRNKNKKIFKRQSSLLSNIEDISKNESIIFISNDDFMKFLESYLYLFYQKKLVYQKQHIENIDCLFEYKISINQLPVN